MHARRTPLKDEGWLRMWVTMGLEHEGGGDNNLDTVGMTPFAVSKSLSCRS